MSDWTVEYQNMIGKCQRQSRSLTNWEQTFLGSLSRQLEEKKIISPKQISTLEIIVERTSKGYRV